LRQPLLEHELYGFKGILRLAVPSVHWCGIMEVCHPRRVSSSGFA